jgi:hypothetical protein
MSSTHNPGRVAGFWYLLLSVIAPLRLMYIPSKLFAPGNATATVSNIAAHEWLFRFGIMGDLVCGVILIFLVLAFAGCSREWTRTSLCWCDFRGRDASPHQLCWCGERRWRPNVRARSRFLVRFRQTSAVSSVA